MRDAAVHPSGIRKNQKWIKQVLFALTPSLALFIALNILAHGEVKQVLLNRFILFNGYYEKTDLPDLDFVWQPNLRGKWHEYFAIKIDTNEQGFRSRPFSPRENALRIMLLGDSIAFGVFIDREFILSNRIEVKLKEQNLDAQVFNLGMPAYDMAHYAAAYRQYSNSLDPNIVLLQMEAGDFDAPPFYTIPSKYIEIFPLAIWLYERYVLSREPDQYHFRINGLRFFHEMVSDCRKNGRRLIILFFPYLDKDFQPGDDMKVVIDSGVEYIDVQQLFSQVSQNHVVFRARPNDTIHPNSGGMEIVASAVAKRIAD